MDLETGLVCIGVVAVSAIVVFLTSVMGVRETTYEEAILEHRKRNNLDSLLSTSSSSKATKKDKRDKKEKKEKKAVPAKKLQKSTDNANVDKEVVFTAPESVTDSANEPVSNSDEADYVEAETPKHQDHVEFKDVDQIIILNEEEAEHLSQRRVSRDEKPRKPILVNNKDHQDVTFEQNPPVKTRRGNSFDVVHPKDDFELIKHQEEKRRSLANSREDLQKDIDLEVADTVSALPNGDQSSEVGDYSDVNQVDNKAPGKSGRKQRKGKQSPQPNIVVASHDLTAADLISSVKKLPLSNDDVQSLINELLNRQSEESNGEWMQKNDPVATLKKQLQEKEVVLAQETSNLDAAKSRLREIRQELDQEKVKQSGLQNRLALQQQDIQALQVRLQQQQQQAFENHRKELSTLQAKLQAKAVEERNVALQRLQDENNRLQYAIKKIEQERPTAEVFSQMQMEIEKLHSERQQFERRHSALQLQNEELLRSISSLDEALKAANGNRQKEEYNYQQKVGDVSSKLQKAETERIAIADELSNTHTQCANLECEVVQLKRQAEKLNSEKDEVVSQLELKVNELNITKGALEDARQSVQQVRDEAAAAAAKLNGGSSKVNGISEENEKLQVDLTARLEEVERLKKELSDQRSLNDQLNDTKKQDVIKSEKLAQDKLLEAVREAEQKASEEAKLLNKSHSELKNRLAGVETERNKLDGELCNISETLRKEFPELTNGKDDELVAVVRNLVEKFKSSSSVKIELSDVNETLNKKEEEVNNLQSQIENYKSTLSETHEILKNYESKAIVDKEALNEVSRLRVDNETLVKQKKELETTIKELQGLSQTVVEMEEKLKDLQAKLQGEEDEKRALVTKFEEVSCEATNKVSSVQGKLDKRTKEIEELEQSRAEIEKFKSESEQLRADLEKDKKLLKEAQVQNVRLKSLVKIGEDSIKAEQLRTLELQEQLKLKNGSVSASTPCLATNGNSPQQLKNSSNSLNVNDEGASNK